jgi:fructokinase
MSFLYGGIEAGGTKIICAVASGADTILAETRLATTSAEPNIAQAIAFFREQEQRLGKLAAIGIGSFGPLDPRPGSPTDGYLTGTPKPGWAHTDFAGPFRQAFGVPVGFDTDVNAAALGEWRWGAGQGLNTLLYLTVGTGIGGGMIVNGQCLHGLLHPEMGHTLVPHDRRVDPFEGSCVYHGDCLEGLAAGPALERRWGQRGEDLPADHPAWALEAHYLALAVANFIMTLAPERIVLGGGVMARQHMFPMLRDGVKRALRGYFLSPAQLEALDSYIVPPALDGRAGVLGALALAEAVRSSPAGLS